MTKLTQKDVLTAYYGALDFPGMEDNPEPDGFGMAFAVEAIGAGDANVQSCDAREALSRLRRLRDDLDDMLERLDRQVTLNECAIRSKS